MNAQAANLDTPWLLAGARGRTEIIAMMLPSRPDLTIRNRFGGNALIPACERAHVEAVPLLLAAGIDVNHVNNLGWTCLLEIVILGDGGPRHQEVARLVLAAGADPKFSPTKTGSHRSRMLGTAGSARSPASSSPPAAACGGEARPCFRVKSELGSARRRPARRSRVIRKQNGHSPDPPSRRA